MTIIVPIDEKLTNGHIYFLKKIKYFQCILKSKVSSYFRSMKSKRFFSIVFFLMIISSIPVITAFIKQTKSVSRKDTTDTAALSWATEKLANMTLEEKIGQFFMVSAYSNQGEKHLQEIEGLVTNEKVGGIIFFQGEKENLISSIKRFQGAAKIPLLISMDAEWEPTCVYLTENVFHMLTQLAQRMMWFCPNELLK